MGDNTDDNPRNLFGFYSSPRVKEVSAATTEAIELTDATVGTTYSEIITPVKDCIGSATKAVSFNPEGEDNVDAVRILTELNTEVERVVLNQPALTKTEKVSGTMPENPSIEQPGEEARRFKLSS